MGIIYSPVSPDNQAIRETRDLLKESKKQSTYMLILTIFIVIMTLMQIYLAIIN